MFRSYGRIPLTGPRRHRQPVRKARGKRIAALGRYIGVGVPRMDFAEFYASAKDDCLRAVLASTGDRQAAEDLTAEAFARAWTAWRTVSRHPAPRAWVVRTALNLRVSWWRRRRREVTLNEADATEAPPDGGRGTQVDADLMAALRRLPVRQRQVVALRLFLDLDTAETAALLGIAPGTVTAHLARAIAALREAYTPAGSQENA
jgi:RNA polymerase sigma-70 factor (sigma-E family)